MTTVENEDRMIALTAATAALGLADIKRVLPHRYPMLLVDRVTDLVPGVGLTAYKAVTANEPWYRDLADDADPAYPRTLLVESWCQAAGVLVAWAEPNPDVLSGQVMLFGGMADIEFSAPVLPGDVLEHRVRLMRALSDTVLFEGESLVGGEPVLRVGRVVMAMRPAEELSPHDRQSR
ncbi:3-hydroxyacyl-ACP dehydratase FabZ family protein [Streptosporangium pseudovulgare]|uniref:3-hydroxyacyl-[acyl-carrier-protein] dehydratase FabZ n=1 Tax=Streptosporangium pseudovulgare TaxID=35765 RepID=A0ABQ2R3H8_9ACTN|nr:3-hydroxyacyl-ACP dehydratase FabZ family protein [Streptosporangium pseudovulgare]GGQ06520.1 3-hydroxyacyl-[acyl-carrier-protein] dehydratase FabZ [Streptosporangium pseudovulgare]